MTIGFAANARGGNGAPVIVCRSGDEANAALKAATGPTTLLLEGKITKGNTGLGAILLDGKKQVTLRGAPGVSLEGVGVHLKNGTSDIIIEGLKIGLVTGGPKDCIGMEGGCKLILIRNNDLSGDIDQGSKDLYDGLIDIKRGCEQITVMWNRLSDHHKCMLIGMSDSDTHDWRVSIYANYFHRIGSRGPSVRGGLVEVVNNVYEGVGESGINSRVGARVLVMNNLFEGAQDPIGSFYTNGKFGDYCLKGNVGRDIRWGTSTKATRNPGTLDDAGSTIRMEPSFHYPVVDFEELEARAGLPLSGEPLPQPEPDPTPAPAPQPVPPATAPTIFRVPAFDENGRAVVFKVTVTLDA